MKTYFWLAFLISLCHQTSAQELFNLVMPASTIPKNSLVMRGFTEWYQEAGKIRSMGAFGFSYGIRGNLMVRMMLTGSNHHDKYLPKDLVNHRHIGNQVLLYSNNQASSTAYQFRLSGVNFYTQWRFFAKDFDKEHFRMAIYGEYSTSKSAHDEAESNLWDDNAGFGTGLIFTYLKNRLAVSFTGGVILPKDYEEINNQGVHTLLKYQPSYNFSLSLGYLLWPRKYETYKQKNTNLYLEFLGKHINGLKAIIQDEENIPLENTAHLSSFYLEVHPGIQQILNSKTRLELSIGFPLIGRSYAHFTPIFQLGLRHYFFL